MRRTAVLTLSTGLATTTALANPSFGLSEASSAASATAEITSRQILSAGEGQPITFEITSTYSPTAGVIDTIRINFPVTEAAVGASPMEKQSAPPGWELQVTRLDGTHFVTYRRGLLAPYVPSSFTVRADVGAVSSPRTGDFRIQVSDDGFASSSSVPAGPELLVTNVPPS